MLKERKYRAGCKINLNLHIVGRRENGYHELDSLFYPLAKPYDTLIIKEGKEPFLNFFCDTKGIDLKDNTLTKAYTLFAERTSFTPSIELELIKGIPHGAGLGGGSADAAFLLKYLYRLYKKQDVLPESFLEKEIEYETWLKDIAFKVGADVPFFLYNKPMRAQGAGEILESFDTKALEGLYLILISPRIYVNTKNVFTHFSKQNQIITKKFKKNEAKGLTSEINKAIYLFDAKEKNIEMEEESLLFENDLELSAFSLFPILKKYKEILLSFHAQVALMSGSGSSLFALYKEKEQAKKAKAFFESKDISCFFAQL